MGDEKVLLAGLMALASNLFGTAAGRTLGRIKGNVGRDVDKRRANKARRQAIKAARRRK